MGGRGGGRGGGGRRGGGGGGGGERECVLHVNAVSRQVAAPVARHAFDWIVMTDAAAAAAAATEASTGFYGWPCTRCMLMLRCCHMEQTGYALCSHSITSAPVPRAQLAHGHTGHRNDTIMLTIEKATT